jgi:hypothetical protein
MQDKGKFYQVMTCMQPLWLVMIAVVWPWNLDGPWMSSSRNPISPLAHPSLEERSEILPGSPTDGFSFVAYGDQRSLADGEWQEMVTEIAKLDGDQGGLSFIIDTGDIVYNGKYTDQWQLLTEIISPLAHLPYLVGVGNHEIDSNGPTSGRANTALYLKGLDRKFGVDRMYYSKDLGKIRFLFLDSNDFVYGENGDQECPVTPIPGGRAEAQLIWLDEQLATSGDFARRVVIIHHPFIQSSRKHRRDAIALWNYSWRGRSLPDILADGDVDLILTGNTHTHERFRLIRDDGKRMTLINISGRPRDGWLWFGKGKRRAHDIRGEEREYLVKAGWTGLESWELVQEEPMIEKQANNFGLFTVDREGMISVEMFFLHDDFTSGIKRERAVLVQ